MTYESLIFTGTEEPVTCYPNLKQDLSIRINGNKDDIAQASVSTLAGGTIEHFNSLKTNIDHQIGNNWPVGMY